jgi:XTP/dITP diphosphohydrolase/tetrapyrrole methylase family protein/MazG family protein/ATP diphosphatase
VPRGLPDAGLQERAEGHADADPGERDGPGPAHVHARELSDPSASAAAVERLDALTRRLRVECPWDREQDERSIVPHTVEEAYELADAAIAGDDDKMVDELGDVLFQVYFLSLLLEERGAGDLAAVADRLTEKLIRRHPHVFGEVEIDSADGVVRNWDAIKRDESGSIFGDLPENLPATLYARKIQRRAANAGVTAPEPVVEDAFGQIGKRLYDLVADAREQDVDPELALRAYARQFMEGASE